MKKDRNYGAPYPIYPGPQYQGMVGVPMTGMLNQGMPSTNNIDQQINLMQQQINALDKRITKLENAGNSTYNKFSENETNYHMM